MLNKMKSWTDENAKNEYLQRLIKSEKATATKYNKSRPHQIGQFIKHPKFGLGFIQAKLGENRIHVFFEQIEKNLLQNWI